MDRQNNYIRIFASLSAKDVAIAGGKGASLGEMTQAGIAIPPGFVVCRTVFDHCIATAALTEKINAILRSIDYTDQVILAKAAQKIKALILCLSIPDDIVSEIQQHFKALRTKYVAVRSSSIEEDSANAAWAGQLESYLDTTQNDLLNNIKKCWASLYAPRALVYRFEKGLHKNVFSLAVVIQKMIASEAAGVAFSIHPITQNAKQLVIEAGFGLGEAIVSGKITPQNYVVDKTNQVIVNKIVVPQKQGLYRSKYSKPKWRSLTKTQQKRPVLSERQIIALARIVMQIEQHYRFPCDVEWSLSKGRFYIVQSRPITTVAMQKDSVVPAVLPQVKNVAYIIAQYQSYQHNIIYFNYPSLVFYTCLTWYWLTDQSQKYFGTTIPFCLVFIKEGAGSLEAPFYIGPGDVVYKQLEQEKLRWIRKNGKIVTQTERAFLTWLVEHPVQSNLGLNNYLYLLNEVLHSFLPAHIHMQISTQVDELLKQKLLTLFNRILKHYSPQELFKFCVSTKPTDLMRHDVALKQLYQWCQTKKIDLSASTFAKNLQNKIFKRRLQECYNLGYALRSGYGGVVLWSLQDEYGLLVSIRENKGTDQLRREEESRRFPKLRLTTEQKTWLTIAQYFSEIRDRRKSLQQRTFYYMAQILEEIGHLLNVTRADLEYLLISEFKLPFLADKVAVRKLIAERKRGYLGFWAPATGMWEWRGSVASRVYQKIPKVFAKATVLKGQSACGGKVKGYVRIVLNPRLQKQFIVGEVLVTGMTSPDFVPLIEKASAIVTERGGITCHAAIIAREFNKPCVISTLIATKVLKDGDFVEVDADNGLVRLLKQPSNKVKR